MTRRMVARLDNIGDVLLSGPAVRAVANAGGPVTFVSGPRGAEAAKLLPGVFEVIVFDAPWVGFEPDPLDPVAVHTFLERIRSSAIDEAIVLTSFHQSPLPLALLLRLAGVARIAATCVDYPGALLDIRHPYDDDLHEVEQALSLCAAAGHGLPDGDDGRLLIDLPHDSVPEGYRDYVVVHPGASVPARALPVDRAHDVVAALAAAEFHVVVTGSPDEAALAQAVASGAPTGSVSVACGATLTELAVLISGANAVVCGNTGVAHVAAAVGTPVVEAFAPVVPVHRWRPWQVPHVVLGVLDIACVGCRARRCPLPGQPCLEPFTADAVMDAIESLVSAPCGRSAWSTGASR